MMSKRGKYQRGKKRSEKMNTRPLRKRVLIVCEGGKTEPNYFESFPIDERLFYVKTVGEGYNTISLVKKAKKTQKDTMPPFDKVWCVFDRDSFPSGNFNKAIDEATKNDMEVAYSNEAFELWYLLHFNYYDSAMSRNQYKEKLCELLPFKYEKTDECSKKMYDELLGKQSVAVRNAEMLFNHHLEAKGRINPEEDNPSTTVHRLVEELNKMLS